MSGALIQEVNVTSALDADSWHSFALRTPVALRTRTFDDQLCRWQRKHTAPLLFSLPWAGAKKNLASKSRAEPGRRLGRFRLFFRTLSGEVSRLSSLAAVLRAPGRRSSTRGGPAAAGKEEPPQPPHQMSVGRPHFTGATLPLASSPSRRPKQRPPFPGAPTGCRDRCFAVLECLYRIAATSARRRTVARTLLSEYRGPSTGVEPTFSPFGICWSRARLLGRPASIGSAPRKDLRRRRCFAGGSC